MTTIKRSFLIGCVVGLLALLFTHLSIQTMPNTGPISIFSKIYHIVWLLTGLAWNENVEPAFNPSPQWLPIFRLLGFAIFYGFLFGFLGLIVTFVSNLFRRKPPKK